MSYDDRDLAGIGGWLAFFFISITILSPLSMVVMTAAQLYGAGRLAAFYGSVWPLVQFGEWAIVALCVGGFWFMAWRLQKVENWKTVRIVIAGLWVIGMGGPILEFLLIASTGMVDASQLVEVVGTETFRPLIANTLWTAYFLRSRRVANTYPKEGTHAEVAEIFS